MSKVGLAVLFMGVPAVMYLGQGVLVYAAQGRHGMAMAMAGYTFANVGFILDAMGW